MRPCYGRRTVYQLLLLSGLIIILRSEHVYSLTEKNFTNVSGTIRPELVEGRYENNLHLVYNVKVPNGKRTKLIFNTTFDVSGAMPNCSQDSLEIFVGCQKKSLGKFCGGSKPLDIYSKDECITLVFKSDCNKTGKGFEAFYSSFDKGSSVSNNSACSNLTQSTVGNFFSPLWPNHYSPNLTCVWKLTIPNGYKSRIYFMNLRIEDNNACNPHSLVDDYVRIEAFNGKSNVTVERRLCTQYSDKTFFVNVDEYPVVYVAFVSDKDSVAVEQTGFAAGFMSYKPGVTVGDYTCGEISVPSTPNTTSVPSTTSVSTRNPSGNAMQSSISGVLIVIFSLLAALFHQ